MIFEITGLLLERLVEVSNRIGVTVAEAAKRVFDLGLGQSDQTQKDTVPTVETKTVEEFIRANYQTMSDREIAEKLNYSPVTIGINRRSLGLLKRRSFNWSAKVYLPNDGQPPTLTEEPTSLTEEQKQQVLDRLPTMRPRKIAIELGVEVGEIFRTRKEIVQKFVSENWQKMSDSEMAKALGFKHGTSISQVRMKLGLSRLDLKSENRSRVSIDKEELRKAINEDGETMTEFGCKRGLKVSRERIRQIANDLGIDTKLRIPLWYANRYNKPELADKLVVERLLAEKGRAPSAAAAVGLTESRFLRICKAHGITPPKNRQPTEMVELTCSQCAGKFKRRKTLIETQKRKHPEQKVWFCTKKCQGKKLGSLKGTGEKVNLTCSACGKQFERNACLVKVGQKQFFCSKKCRYEMLPRGCHGEGRVELVCDNDNCGKKFTRTVSQARKSVRHFCGSQCAGMFLGRACRRKPANTN